MSSSSLNLNPTSKRMEQLKCHRDLEHKPKYLLMRHWSTKLGEHFQHQHPRPTVFFFLQKSPMQSIESPKYTGSFSAHPGRMASRVLQGQSPPIPTSSSTHQLFRIRNASVQQALTQRVATANDTLPAKSTRDVEVSVVTKTSRMSAILGMLRRSYLLNTVQYSMDTIHPGPTKDLATRHLDLKTSEE
ncbi:MAG: hypothetical protein J3Q66DRAFT_334450 [Benniella sp.]|nr:MAG: hypothetical protein J3Q66DRAFT_334450 [Benniella sp.]